MHWYKHFQEQDQSMHGSQGVYTSGHSQPQVYLHLKEHKQNNAGQAEALHSVQAS